MTDCTAIPTLQDIEDSKLAMDDIQSITYSPTGTFVDAKGVTRKTINGLVDPVDAAATQGLIDINADVASVNDAADGFDANAIDRLNDLDAAYAFTAINNGVWAEFETFTALNQYMVFSGTAYKPKNTTSLPYVVGASPVSDANVEVVANLSTAQGDTRYPREFEILADAIASNETFAGQSIRVIDRNIIGGGGGAVWKFVLKSSVIISTNAPTAGPVVESTGDLTLALVLRVENSLSFKEMGAIIGTDTHLVFDEINAFKLANPAIRHLLIESGGYILNDDDGPNIGWLIPSDFVTSGYGAIFSTTNTTPVAMRTVDGAVSSYVYGVEYDGFSNHLEFQDSQDCHGWHVKGRDPLNKSFVFRGPLTNKCSFNFSISERPEFHGFNCDQRSDFAPTGISLDDRNYPLKNEFNQCFVTGKIGQIGHAFDAHSNGAAGGVTTLNQCGSLNCTLFYKNQHGPLVINGGYFKKTSTTGSITIGTNSLVVASTNDMTVGMEIQIEDDNDLADRTDVNIVTAIVGTTVTLQNNSTVTLADARVLHAQSTIHTGGGWLCLNGASRNADGGKASINNVIFETGCDDTFMIIEADFSAVDCELRITNNAKVTFGKNNVSDDHSFSMVRFKVTSPDNTHTGMNVSSGGLFNSFAISESPRFKKWAMVDCEFRVPMILDSISDALLRFDGGVRAETLQLERNHFEMSPSSVALGSVMNFGGKVRQTAITAATQANPVQITVTDHPYNTGDEVLISDVVGMTEINDRVFTITDTGDDTFTLDGEDGTGHTAYVSGGEASLDQNNIDTAIIKDNTSNDLLLIRALTDASCGNLVLKRNDNIILDKRLPGVYKRLTIDENLPRDIQGTETSPTVTPTTLISNVNPGEVFEVTFNTDRNNGGATLQGEEVHRVALSRDGTALSSGLLYSFNSANVGAVISLNGTSIEYIAANAVRMYITIKRLTRFH